MTNSSPWLRLVAVFSASFVFIGFGSRMGQRVLASKRSGAVVQSYSFMPGQSMDFQNRKFHRIEVRSIYPIRVLSGPCHQEYVVQFFCESKQPGDIFITDRRKMPFLRTPEANEITITEMKK